MCLHMPLNSYVRQSLNVVVFYNLSIRKVNNCAYRVFPDILNNHGLTHTGATNQIVF
jgi:hypothetical protein